MDLLAMVIGPLYTALQFVIFTELYTIHRLHIPILHLVIFIEHRTSVDLQCFFRISEGFEVLGYFSIRASF